MTDDKARIAIANADAAITGYYDYLNTGTGSLRESVRDAASVFRDETQLKIAETDLVLTKQVELLAQDANYRILNAYYHASPGLIAIITDIIKLVANVIKVIQTLNQVIHLLTGQNLAYWIDQLVPGFNEVWNNIMNKISEVSKAIGWGVDGAHHLLNVINSGVDLYSITTGKDQSYAYTEKYKHLDTVLHSYSAELKGWQEHPGTLFSAFGDRFTSWYYARADKEQSKLRTKITEVGEKTELALTSVGEISSELLALRNDMPAFIAKNLPQGLWDSLARFDTAINDRILPQLQAINDKIDELNAVLDAQRKKAAELADKIAHPGDMLADIENLSEYARKDQYDKIDYATSQKLREENEVDYAAIEGDLSEFSKVAAALAQAPAPLSFMQLELPGKSPGIVAEPRETWFVGDY
jgi:hypothetical protein